MKNTYSKEVIKSRIFNLASSFWNIRNFDALDPLIKLLVEAIANEIYRIYSEVNNMETRLLEKLANTLTPDLLISPSPAHAILHIQPSEHIFEIDNSYSVRYENPAFIKRHKLREMAFSPVCTTKLFKGDIKYLMLNGDLYQYDLNYRKELIYRSGKTYTQSKKIWIGLELDKRITNIQDLSFYIDLPNITDKNEYLYLLPYSVWEINGQKIEMTNGIFNTNNVVENPNPFYEYETSNRINKNILKTYDKNYLHVAKSREISIGKTKLPNVFHDLYEEDILANMGDQLQWISIELPPHFSSHIINDITVHINTFPIANMMKKKINQKVEDILAIIPLSTANNEYFLSVESLMDSANKQYHEVLSQENRDNLTGTYSLRRGGAERFDSREAGELISRLSDMLSDESAAFSYNSRNSLSDTVEKLNKLIAQLNQFSSAKGGNDKQLLHYIFIDEMKDKDVFEVNYWITNCELGNQITAGSALMPYSTSAFNTKSIILISNTYGGKTEPRSREKIDMYKYVLTTSNRIVTSDDIKVFCKMELGDLIESTEIKKGVAVSNKPKEGLMRTLDIYLTLNKSYNQTYNLERIKGDLKDKLIEKSPDTYNYRIFIL